MGDEKVGKQKITGERNINKNYKWGGGLCVFSWRTYKRNQMMLELFLTFRPLQMFVKLYLQFTQDFPNVNFEVGQLSYLFSNYFKTVRYWKWPSFKIEQVWVVLVFYTKFCYYILRAPNSKNGHLFYSSCLITGSGMKDFSGVFNLQQSRL